MIITTLQQLIKSFAILGYSSRLKFTAWQTVRKLLFRQIPWSNQQMLHTKRAHFTVESVPRTRIDWNKPIKCWSTINRKLRSWIKMKAALPSCWLLLPIKKSTNDNLEMIIKYSMVCEFINHKTESPYCSETWKVW